MGIARPNRAPLRGLVASLILTAALSAGWNTPAAAQDLDTRARTLASLRAEVEALSTEVNLAKEDLRGQLRSIDTRIAEADSEIRREEVRLTQLEGEAERLRQLIAAQGANADVLAPAVLDGIGSLRRVIDGGLPYRLDERRAALAELETGLTSGNLSAEDAAARLWGLAEDELRLARENGLDKQVVVVDGAEILVEVARLGMVALYYRTDDGRYGAARRDGATWTWSAIDGADAQAQLSDLFDALDKGIRVGWFELPPALAEVSR